MKIFEWPPEPGNSRSRELDATNISALRPQH
jgi:hypothetical protein